MIVVDSSALLAYLFEEDGGQVVADYQSNIVMSAVNYAETLLKLTRRGAKRQILTDFFQATKLTVVPFSQLEADIVPIIAPDATLSLADRACLATAQIANCPALTADKDWRKLELPIEVRLIR